MSGLDEARRKIEERRAQQGQGGGGMDLWMREGDLVIAHTLFSGEDGDPYFEAYMAHEEPARGQGQYPTKVYCPVESDHDQNYDCPGCKNGLKVKPMMLMWFWVYDILHTTLKPNEQFPQVSWNNKAYFRREVNGPKLWDTSAWRESCFDDILMLKNQLGDLRKTRVNLLCTGNGMARRYKFYMEPGSPPIDQALLEQGWGMIEPAMSALTKRLSAVPTQANPAVAQPTAPSAPATGPVPYSPPGNVVPYTPKTTAASAEAVVATPAEAVTAPKPAGRGKKQIF